MAANPCISSINGQDKKLELEYCIKSPQIFQERGCSLINTKNKTSKCLNISNHSHYKEKSRRGWGKSRFKDQSKASPKLASGSFIIRFLKITFSTRSPSHFILQEVGHLIFVLFANDLHIHVFRELFVWARSKARYCFAKKPLSLGVNFFYRGFDILMHFRF